jgi:hypothetical protein
MEGKAGGETAELSCARTPGLERPWDGRVRKALNVRTGPRLQVMMSLRRRLTPRKETPMLTFKDFAPRVLQSPGLLSAGQYADVHDTVRAADSWLREHGIRPLNVETLIAPVPSLPGGIAYSVFAPTDETVKWFQFVRVWYETK